MSEKIKKYLPVFALIVLLLLSIGLRLYDLTDEPLDWNMIRQLRDTTLARSIYYNILPGADPAVQAQAAYLASHLEVLELPILEGLMALLYLPFGENPWLVRPLLGLCWGLAAVFIYQIGKRHFSPWAMLAALFYFLFLPFGVMASRAFQPDAWMVMWVMLSYLALYRYTEKETWRTAVLAGLAAGWAILIKPTAALYVGPAYLAVILTHFGVRYFWRKAQVWAMAGLALLPVTVYFLFTSGSSSEHFRLWVVGMHSLRTSLQFYLDWVLNVKRLTGLAFIGAALSGVLISPPKYRALLIGGWIGYGLYGMFYPFQYSTHDYYHLFIVPLITLSLAPLFDLIVGKLKETHWVWRIAFIGLLFAGAVIGAMDVKKDLDARDYRPEAAAWAAIGAQIPEDGCLLTLATDYGLRLRYYGWRATCQTWPTLLDFSVYEQAGKGSPDYAGRFAESIESMDYFVVLSMEEWQQQPQLRELLLEKYPQIGDSNEFIVFDLEP